MQIKYSPKKKGIFIMGNMQVETLSAQKAMSNFKGSAIVLGKTTKIPLDPLAMKTKRDGKYQPFLRNPRIIVFGPKRTRKTESIIEPNIKNMKSSYVIMDPDGVLKKKYAQMLKQKGYTIKILGEQKDALVYNPFEYLRPSYKIDDFANIIYKYRETKEEENENSKTDKIAISFLKIMTVCVRRDYNGDAWQNAADEIQYLCDKEDVMTECIKHKEGRIFANVFTNLSNYEIESIQQYIEEIMKEEPSGEEIHEALKTAQFVMQNVINWFHTKDRSALQEIPQNKTAVFICQDKKDASKNWMYTLMLHQINEEVKDAHLSAVNGKTQEKEQPLLFMFPYMDNEETPKIYDPEKFLFTMRGSTGFLATCHYEGELREKYKDETPSIFGGTDICLVMSSLYEKAQVQFFRDVVAEKEQNPDWLFTDLKYKSNNELVLIRGLEAYIDQTIL